MLQNLLVVSDAMRSHRAESGASCPVLDMSFLNSETEHEVGPISRSEPSRASRSPPFAGGIELGCPLPQRLTVLTKESMT